MLIGQQDLNALFWALPGLLASLVVSVGWLGWHWLLLKSDWPPQQDVNQFVQSE